jgi:hypothetical protein
MKFETAVKDYMVQHQCTLAAAIKKVAETRPDLHRDYVIRCREGRAESLSLKVR